MSVDIPLNVIGSPKRVVEAYQPGFEEWVIRDNWYPDGPVYRVDTRPFKARGGVRFGYLVTLDFKPTRDDLLALKLPLGQYHTFPVKYVRGAPEQS